LDGERESGKGSDDKHQKTARVGTGRNIKHSLPFSASNQFFALRNIKFLMLNENLARFTFSLVHFSISEIVTGEWESSGEARKNGDKFLETRCLWLLEKRRYLERAAEN
jgi:hypothetical protein